MLYLLQLIQNSYESYLRDYISLSIWNQSGTVIIPDGGEHIILYMMGQLRIDDTFTNLEPLLYLLRVL